MWRSVFFFLFFFEFLKVEIYGFTIGRILTRTMGVDGSAWWVKILGVSSLILKDPSSTLNWRLSISSSSKGLLPPPLTEAKGSVSTKFKRKAEDGGKSAPHFSDGVDLWCGLKWKKKSGQKLKVQK